MALTAGGVGAAHPRRHRHCRRLARQRPPDPERRGVRPEGPAAGGGAAVAADPSSSAGRRSGGLSLQRRGGAAGSGGGHV
jgi:hypothetical protein